MEYGKLTSCREAQRSVCFAPCGWLVKIVVLIDMGVKLAHLKEAFKAFPVTNKLVHAHIYKERITYNR